MTILNCKRLRRIVMLSGSFLIVSMFAEVIAHLLSSSFATSYVQSVALVMLLASPVVMLLTIIVSLIPGVRLIDCSR